MEVARPANSTVEECLAELDRLGWNVRLSDDGTTWRLAAVHGQQSWLFVGTDIRTVCEAALEMAQRNMGVSQNH
jgi:hypothetical protein